MSITRFKFLFQKYVSKTDTAEEREEFLALARHTANDEELKSLLAEHWETGVGDSQMSDNKAEEIYSHIVTSNAGGRALHHWRLSWQAAAAVIIICGVSAMLYFSRGNELKKMPAQARLKTESTPLQKRRMVNLPDGSTVILNGNSTLNFEASFNTNGRREVYLVGEAYFDIKHDPGHPFIVHTGKLRTTVLGTAFDIRAFPDDKDIVVTVKRGKVKVGDAQRTYDVILKDEQIVYHKNADQHMKAPVNANAVVAWKNEDIYFDDVTMQDLAAQLQERFSVTIDFASDKIRGCRLSGTFLKSQNLKQILDVIGEFNQIKYQFNTEKSIVLSGEGCK
jgi:transmembrane sensor